MNRILALLLALLVATPAGAIDINGYLKKAALEPLSSDPSTTLTGRVYYNTTSNSAKVYTGSAWQGLGGSGSGEKNYLSTGANSAAGWTASGAGVTCTTVTSGLPDATVGTALAVTGVSGSTAYCFSNFDLDQADYNKKMKLAFDQAPVSGYAAGDQRADVYSCTVAWSGSPATTCSGTATRLPLSTDSSAVSALPNLTGTYRTTWDSPGSAAAHIQVRVGLNSSNTHQNNFAQVVTGPGVVTQGAAVSGWTTQASYTSITNGAITSPTRNQLVWRRVGANMEMRFIWGGGTAVNNTSNNVTFNMPAGYTIDTSALANTSQRDMLGSAQWVNSAGTTRNALFPVYGSTTTLVFQKQGGTVLIESDLGTNWELDFSVSVPIAEWAGSGTVNVGSNGPAYGCNTTTTGTANTQFNSGSTITPAGCTIPAVDSTQTGNQDTDYKVTFPFPIDQGSVKIQSSSDGVNWADGGQNGWITGRNRQSTAEYGMWIQTIDCCSVYVVFGNAGSQTTGSYGTAASSNTWSGLNGAGWKYRVVAYPSNGATGFASASDTSFGLVKLPAGYTQTTVPDYEAGSFSLTLSGPRTTTDTLFYVRVGKIVTLYFPTDTGTCSVATGFTSSAGTIPGSITPARAQSVGFGVQNSGTYAFSGQVNVNTSGSLTLCNSLNSCSFTGSGSCGWSSTTVTYSIQ